MRRQAQLVWLLGLVMCASWIGGCARFPGWDTTQGVPTYVSPPGPLVTAPEARDVRIVVNPAEQVVPIGAEVAVVASVCVAGEMRANQPVSWTLEGVGQLRGAGGVGGAPAGINPTLWPQATSPNNGQSTTFPNTAVVTRGSQDPGDDFSIQRGQTWMSLTSQQEGTSIITASAPTLLDPSSGQAVARVHWVDAQWTFPQSTNAGLGATVPLTTTVTQPSTGAPAPGYLVRYEIAGGAAAGFAPDGATVREVQTDASGAATVDLIQTQPAMGTTQVQIQIIRDIPQPVTPNAAQPASPRVVLGRSALTVNWTSDVTINLSGPSQVSAGADADFAIDVANPGEQTIAGTRVTMNLPQGWTIVGTDPVAMQSGNQFSFDLGDLAPNATENMVIRYKVGANRAAELCAELTSTSGARVRDCLRTSVASAALVVSLRRRDSGPIQVGDQVTWDITVRNNGNAPTPAGLLIKDTYDAGLRHEESPDSIEKDLDSIAPGAADTFPVTLTAVAAGRACQHLTVTNPDTGQLFAESRDCVEITQQQAPARRELAVRKTGPLSAKVGDTPTFQIEVTNTGDTTLRNVRVVDSYSNGLRPIQASEGSQYEEPAGEYRLTWIVDVLGPGQFARFDVQCACEIVGTRICSRVNVESEDGTRDNDELCLDVRPDRQPVTVSISQLNDTVTAGNDATYEVSIKNDTAATETQIQLNFSLAGGMTVNRLGTRGPRGTGDYQLDGSVLRFNPMPELLPGETLRYTIRVRVTQPGVNQVRASVSGGSLREPLQVTESTTVN